MKKALKQVYFHLALSQVGHTGKQHKDTKQRPTLITLSHTRIKNKSKDLNYFKVEFLTNNALYQSKERDPIYLN